MRTRIALETERRARNPEVRGSSLGSGSSILVYGLFMYHVCIHICVCGMCFVCMLSELMFIIMYVCVCLG